MNQRLKDALKVGIYYRATSSTKDGSIRAGDRIMRVDGGEIDNASARFSMPCGEWENYRCGVKIDRKFYEERMEPYEKKIEEVKCILKMED